MKTYNIACISDRDSANQADVARFVEIICIQRNNDSDTATAWISLQSSRGLRPSIFLTTCKIYFVGIWVSDSSTGGEFPGRSRQNFTYKINPNPFPQLSGAVSLAGSTV